MKKKLIADPLADSLVHPLVHPLELMISGYSGSGKTTIISKLVKSLSSKYDIAYYKHNAHGFEMDQKGKDTAVIKESGARSVLINDPDKMALIGEKERINPSNDVMLSGHDFVIIEGGKNEVSDKILLLDDNLKILDKVHSGEITRVLATVGTMEREEIGGTESAFLQELNLPYFQRDQVEKLTDFVEKYLIKKSLTPINALIMVGGKSLRMGKDKFSLSYRGENQVSRLHNLLGAFCKNVYVSCREDQPIEGYPVIYDRILGFGPMGGIVSAQLTHPDTAWLVVAVDMPYIDEDAISCLIENRNPFKMATCYYNSQKEWPEPLITIYEPKSKLKLFQSLGLSKSCPRKFLMNSNIEIIQTEQQKILVNVNTPADYKQVVEELS